MARRLERSRWREVDAKLLAFALICMVLLGLFGGLDYWHVVPGAFAYGLIRLTGFVALFGGTWRLRRTGALRRRK